ncbi:unnamed protein product [Urochloa humidicola]
MHSHSSRKGTWLDKLRATLKSTSEQCKRRLQQSKRQLKKLCTFPLLQAASLLQDHQNRRSILRDAYLARGRPQLIVGIGAARDAGGADKGMALDDQPVLWSEAALAAPIKGRPMADTKEGGDQGQAEGGADDQGRGVPRSAGRRSRPGRSTISRATIN